MIWGWQLGALVVGLQAWNTDALAVPECTFLKSLTETGLRTETRSNQKRQSNVYEQLWMRESPPMTRQMFMPELKLKQF